MSNQYTPQEFHDEEDMSCMEFGYTHDSYYQSRPARSTPHFIYRKSDPTSCHDDDDAYYGDIGDNNYPQ